MSRTNYSSDKNLEANKNTQNFSSTSTIEKYSYNVEDSEFASIPVTKQTISHNLIREQVTQMCLNKLNINGNFDIESTHLKNCQAKALINCSLYN